MPKKKEVKIIAPAPKKGRRKAVIQHPSNKDMSKGMIEFELADELPTLPKKRRRRGGDKILDNKYNRGESEFEEFGKPVIETKYNNKYLDPYYNSHDYMRIIKLREELETIFYSSKWAQLLARDEEAEGAKANPKIPKPNLPEIFDFLKQKVEPKDYTHSEVFYAIAACLDVEEDTLYGVIGPAYKEQILIEIDEKCGALRKRKTRKLF